MTPNAVLALTVLRVYAHHVVRPLVPTTDVVGSATRAFKAVFVQADPTSALPAEPPRVKFVAQVGPAPLEDDALVPTKASARTIHHRLPVGALANPVALTRNKRAAPVLFVRTMSVLRVAVVERLVVPIADVSPTSPVWGTGRRLRVRGVAALSWANPVVQTTRVPRSQAIVRRRFVVFGSAHRAGERVSGAVLTALRHVLHRGKSAFLEATIPRGCASRVANRRNNAARAIHVLLAIAASMVAV